MLRAVRVGLRQGKRTIRFRNGKGWERRIDGELTVVSLLREEGSWWSELEVRFRHALS
jgi:hypothetical protein